MRDLLLLLFPFRLLLLLRLLRVEIAFARGLGRVTGHRGRSPGGRGRRRGSRLRALGGGL